MVLPFSFLFLLFMRFIRFENHYSSQKIAYGCECQPGNHHLNEANGTYFAFSFFFFIVGGCLLTSQNQKIVIEKTEGGFIAKCLNPLRYSFRLPSYIFLRCLPIPALYFIQPCRLTLNQTNGFMGATCDANLYAVTYANDVKCIKL